MYETIIESLLPIIEVASPNKMITKNLEKEIEKEKIKGGE